jgi:hypothetical protein
MKNKSLFLLITIVLLAMGSVAQVHIIGEKFGGGIIFYVDSSGQHGLIASTEDQSSDIKWYNGVFRNLESILEDGVGAGAKNTIKIVEAQIKDNPKGYFAAKICADYSVTVAGVIYKDWYLPSQSELDLLQKQKDLVGGFGGYVTTYWSSNEGGGEHRAITERMSDGHIRGWDLDTENRVRAIRAF